MSPNQSLLVAAAKALGPPLLESCAFVGGCTVHLYLDDVRSAIKLRATDDVDVIVEVQPASIIGYHHFSERLKARGFQESAVEGPICRFLGPGGLILDVMATDERVLNFGNAWYAEAFAQANWVNIDNGVNIKLIPLEHFFATKITSWRGRANNDIFHRDAEDILTVIDGVANIEHQFEQASPALRQFVAEGLTQLQQHEQFRFLVDGSLAVYQDPVRTEAAYAKWSNLARRLQF